MDLAKKELGRERKKVEARKGKGLEIVWMNRNGALISALGMDGG
jgi:hypothetical protein